MDFDDNCSLILLSFHNPDCRSFRNPVKAIRSLV